MPRVLGAALAAVATVAVLDASADDRQRAEELVREAEADRAHAAEKHEAAGDLYLSIWRRDGEKACEAKAPGCERMDEVLYNGARAYRAARRLPKAIEVLGVLASPKHNLHRTELATKGLYEIGAMYQAMAAYDQAASFYETFARMKPKSENAPTALKDALVMRLALGEAAQAEADADLFSKSYGSKHARDTAQVMFAVASAAVERGEHEAGRKRLTSMMRAIDRDGAIDVQVLAHAALARAYAALGKAKEAAAEYAVVRGFYRDPPAVIRKLDSVPEEYRDRTLGKILTAVGEAIYFAAEEKGRAADAMKPPVYRGSGRREEIVDYMGNAVAGWVRARRQALEEAEKVYLQALELEPMPPPKWVVRAAARVAELRGNLAEAIRSLPAPAGWKKSGAGPDGERWERIQELWKRERERHGEFDMQHAKGAHKKAVNLSVKWGWSEAGTRASIAWLGKHYPGEIPVLDEIADKPSHRADGMEAAPLPEPAHR